MLAFFSHNYNMTYEDFIIELGNVDYVMSLLNFHRECLECGSLRQRASSNQYQCVKCNDSLSPLKGTLYQGAHYPLSKGFMLTWLLANQPVTNKSLQRKGLAATTIQRFIYRQHERLKNWLEEQELTEIIELDEAYIGKGKGRSNNKGLIIGVEKRKNGSAVPVLKESFDKTTCDNYVIKHVNKQAVIITDGWKGYNNISNHCQEHKIVRSYHELPNVHSAINNLKTYLKTYVRPVSDKYLPGYLAHWAWLYSHRDLTEEERFNQLLKLNLKGGLMLNE